MTRKTLREKRRADRNKRTTHETRSAKRETLGTLNKKREVDYKESDYDKELRAFTISDVRKTLFIILILFALQYAAYYAQINNLWIFSQ